MAREIQSKKSEAIESKKHHETIQGSPKITKPYTSGNRAKSKKTLNNVSTNDHENTSSKFNLAIQASALSLADNQAIEEQAIPQSEMTDTSESDDDDDKEASSGFNDVSSMPVLSYSDLMEGIFEARQEALAQGLPENTFLDEETLDAEKQWNDFDGWIEEQVEKVKPCHGTVVDVTRCGKVRLIHAKHPLTFTIDEGKATEIRALDGQPKIYFNPSNAMLRVRGKVVYEKPVRELESISYEWFHQLLFESATKDNL